MSKANYFKDQNVFAEDLDFTESSRIEDVKQRIQNLLGSSGGIYSDLYESFSIVKGGIFGRPDEYDQNKNLRVGISDTSTLFIYPGDAIDVNGNPIRVESTKTVELGNEDANYRWDATVGTNYVKIRYAQSSGSVGTDDLGNQHYSRYYDSYYVEINGTHPTGSTGDPILLGIFTGLGDGTVSPGTLFDRRLYAKIITPASGVIIDPFRNPVASQITLEDHVAATGSGTPTLKNVHGLSFEDIGGEDTGLHRIQSHINGIIPYDRETSTLNSFKGTVINNSSPTAAVSFTAPSNAVLSVGGKIVSSTLSSLTGASAFSLGGNETYAALVYKDGTTSWILYSTFISTYYDSELGTRIDDTGVNELLTTGHKNADYYLLGICVVASGGNSLTFTDTRSFLTTHPEDIIADFKEDVSSPGDDLTIYSSLEDTLNRIRNQVGIAIAGTGSTWNNTTSALTAGPASNADHLHTHPGLVAPFSGSSFIPYGGQTILGNDITIWTLDTGSIYKTFDYLNLLTGPTGSSFLLDAGVYRISSYIQVSGAGSDTLLLHALTMETIFDIFAQGYSPIITSISDAGTAQAKAVIELQTSGNFSTISTSAISCNLVAGRLDIEKISDYPVS